MSQPKKPATNKGPGQLICLCNSVPKEEIEKAIARGCNTLSKIFDATSAGVGPCGGSCRVHLAYMLECYLQTGEFPQDPKRKR